MKRYAIICVTPSGHDGSERTTGTWYATNDADAVLVIQDLARHIIKDWDKFEIRVEAEEAEASK